MKVYSLSTYDFIGNVYNTPYVVSVSDDPSELEVLTELAIQTDNSLKGFSSLQLKWQNSLHTMAEVLDTRTGKYVGRLIVSE